MDPTRAQSIRFFFAIGSLALAAIYFCVCIDRQELRSSLELREYQSLVNQVALTLEQTETSAESHLKSALHAITPVLSRHKGSIGEAYLKSLAEQHQLSEIYLISREGSLLSSSNYSSLKLQGITNTFNFYKVSSSAKSLIERPEVKTSPFRWLDEVSEPSKFVWTFVPSLSAFLQLSYRVSNLESLFIDTTRNYQRITEISLFSPSGEVLASSIQDHQKQRIEMASEHWLSLDDCKQSDGTYCANPNLRTSLALKTPAQDYKLRIKVRPFDEDLLDFSRGRELLFALPVLIALFLLNLHIDRLLRGFKSLSSGVENYLNRQSIPNPKSSKRRSNLETLSFAFAALQDSNESLQIETSSLLKYQQIARSSSFILHDIRKPFIKIKLVLQDLLKKNRDDGLDLARKLRFTEEATRHADALLASLTDKKGESRISREEKGVFDHIQTCLLHDIDAQEIEGIEIEIMIQNCFKISGEIFKVRRVLTNILQNAVDATPKGGRIKIISGGETGRTWIEICNTGSFLSKQRLTQVFSSFVSFKENGCGLGLPLSQEIIESYGGSLTCQSSPKGETCFRFDLMSGCNREPSLTVSSWREHLATVRCQ